MSKRSYLFIVLFLLSLFSASAENYTNKIRLGIIEEKNLFETDSISKTGYIYEFLQEISKYTNWVYDYYKYSDNWEIQAEKLRRGEIDILIQNVNPSISSDPNFVVSDSPLLITSTALITNPKYAPLWKNPLHHKQLTIGLLKNSSYEEQLRKYLTEKGLPINLKYFSNENDMRKALHETNEIHALLTLQPYESQKELTIVEFEPYKIYFILSKQNSEYLKEINKAMSMIDRYSTAIRSTLNRKYMEFKEHEQVFSLTLDEYFFIEEYKRSGKSIRSLLKPLHKPLSYFDEDTPKGILFDIITTAVKPLDLKFDVIKTSTRDEYTNVLMQEKPGVILSRTKDLSWAEQAEYRFTDPYITLSYSALRLKDYSPETVKVGVIDSSTVMVNYVSKQYNHDQILIYSTMDECINSLLNKETSIVVLDSYTANYYVEKDYKRQFEVEEILGLQYEMCIAVHNSIDPRLYSILNKAVRNISGESRYTIIHSYTYSESASYGFSLVRFLYKNPLRFLGLIIGPIIFLILFGVNVYSVVTQRKVVKAMEEKSRFGSILCTSFDTVSEWNLDADTIHYFFFMENKLVKQKDFFTVTEYIEHAIKNIIHHEDKEAFSNLFNTMNLEAILTHPRTIYKEFRLLTPGSKNKSGYEWNAFTLQAFSTNRPKRCFIVCIKNIDDVKHSEELKNEQLTEALTMAEKANKSKSNFLSRMSHEIRTPLNAMIGFITLAKRTINNPQKALDYISKSEYASKHLLSLINDILDMSAIESGKMKINETVFEFKQFISSLSATFYGQAKLKNIKFSTIVTNNTEEFLCGDQIRLNQILMNILSNAIKFTPVKGEVNFTITQKLTKNKTVFMQFIIADTGIGMSEDFLKKIGKPFEQGSNTIGQEFGGSGLGISISKNLIKAMNGTMTIQSKEGCGSVFSIEIPLGLVEGISTPDVNTSYKGKQALIVTMDKDLGDYEKELFKAFGVDTHITMSIEDIRNHVTPDHIPCSLCLIDTDIHQGDPIAYIKEIKTIVPEQTPLAIISYDYSLIEEEARALHIEHFIQKPLFQSTVLTLLVDILGNHETGLRSIPSVHFAGKHILLAEDNDFNSEIAFDILSSQGFAVDTVKNGLEAVQLFEKAPVNFYDLLLLDIQMPVLDGYKTAKKIRSLSRPDALTVPIIAMTANAFAEDVTAALSSGMNDHIAKPIDTTTLFTVLQKYIHS